MPQKLHCYTCDNCDTVLWDDYYKHERYYLYKDLAFCDVRCFICHEIWKDLEVLEERLESAKVSGRSTDKIDED